MLTCLVNREIITSREYLIVNRDLIAVKTSADVSKFAYDTESIILGRDIRISFPELIGLEDTLIEILQGKKDSFLLEGIARHVADGSLIYFDLVIHRQQEQLIIFLTDVTQSMQLKQSLIQRVNEAEVLLSALKRFEDYTNKIFLSMGDVLFITTASGKLKKVNQAVTKVFGYSESELLHQPISLITTNDNFNHQEIYNSLVTSKDLVKQIELTCLTKAGKKLEIEFSCSAIETQVKGVFNCIYIGRDITARKQTEVKIRKALEKEKELKEIKSRFISTASHEFRNPLSSILICTNFLKNNRATVTQEEQDFYLDLIQAAAQNMQSLLEDILAIGKTEAGKLKFTSSRLSLESFCRQIIKEVAITTGSKKINFLVTGTSSLVDADERLLRHILTNLLDNAIKYSSREEVVELELIYLDAEEKVILEVRDRGIGIPPEAQKHLFDSFYRASNVGDIPGTGLGLSIVKKAIDLHGGEITVKSKVGVGTTVRAILPLRCNDATD